MDDSVHEAAAFLRTAQRIAVLTGAGISAESGIPTFRDALSGHWANFDPQKLATPQAFARDPELVSRWYDQRRCECALCRPNPGHEALARLQKIATAEGREVALITQNVDRLHQTAGSADVIELHGNLWVWRCADCGKEIEEKGPAFSEYPPRCACGGNRRPGVVWFGEALPLAGFAAAQKAAKRCDMFLSIGTSSVVYPAAGLIESAITAGAKALEVNPEATPMSHEVEWSIRGKSGQVLPRLMRDAFGD
ncbi:MAG TPA: NAD-dependent deacylase [Humisphaera sp.]|jgi:NAD-dependent deacetylase|nr:NAD-dependent deacylase [Humisphaera sp.]